MKKTILALLLTALSTGAMADWVRFSEDAEAVLYVDSASSAKNGDLVKMRNLFDFKKVKQQAGASFLSIEMHEEYDCAKKQVRGVGATAFSENMSKGAVVVSDTYFDWMLVAPGSASEDLWKLACGIY